MNRARTSTLLSVLLAACATPADDLYGLATQPPVDRAVLVTGGAFLAPSSGPDRTFGGAALRPGDEVMPIDAFIDVLRRGGVFQQVALDADPAHRRSLRDRLRAGHGDPEMLQFLQQARDDGYDLLLVVEELQDGPIERQGTNGRWPVTFATWLLLGIGALIPDRSYESRATLRITLRELQTGGTLHDPLLLAGPVDLSLVERTDLLGLLESILVPPFWVGDDQHAVAGEVRATTTRRLLLSLARDLKSEAVRQRLRERAAARIDLIEQAGGRLVAVDAPESLSIVRLRGVAAEEAEAFAARLLASMRRNGTLFHYEAALPAGGRDLVQVLVGTQRGAIASATFAPGGGS